MLIGECLFTRSVSLNSLESSPLWTLRLKTISLMFMEKNRTGYTLETTRSINLINLLSMIPLTKKTSVVLKY